MKDSFRSSKQPLRPNVYYKGLLEDSGHWPGPGYFSTVSPIGLHDKLPVMVKANLLSDHRPRSSAWDDLAKMLSDLFNLPHNQMGFERRGKTIQAAVREKLQEVRSGAEGELERVIFRGPMVFLRVAGTSLNRVYTGEWWFDLDLLTDLEKSYSRIYFDSDERKKTIRNMLREFLALATEFNKIEEVWALEVPPGGSIIGFSSRVAPQKLFFNLPLSADGNRMLVGKARQIFFPVKNPFWVKHYSDLVS